MCIATCLTHGKNIVPSYNGTLPQGRSSFARLLFEIQHPSFQSRSLPICGALLIPDWSKMQAAIVAIQTIQP